jgi:tetratricopeptide (TPR) repeat protein
MKAFRRFGLVLPQLVATFLLGIGAVYFVFVYDSRSQVRLQPSSVAAAGPIEQRVETLERAVNSFDQKHQQIIANAEATSWYAEKILRLITVVSIIGTFMTLLGYFSLSGLKATVDDAKRGLEETKKEFEQRHARAISVKDKILAEGKRLGLEAVGGLDEVYVVHRSVDYGIEYYDMVITAWELYESFEWSVYDVLGRYFLSTRQLGKALVRLSDAIERNGSAYSTMYLRGYCHAFLAREVAGDQTRKEELLRQAGWSFEAAYMGDQKNAIHALGVGWILDEVEKYDEAVKWYERALELRPTLVEAKYNIGCALSKSCRPEQAFEILYPIRSERLVKECLAAEGEVELRAIKEWNDEKFRALLS